MSKNKTTEKVKVGMSDKAKIQLITDEKNFYQTQHAMLSRRNSSLEINCENLNNRVEVANKNLEFISTEFKRTNEAMCKLVNQLTEERKTSDKMSNEVYDTLRPALGFIKKLFTNDNGVN